MEKNMHTYEIFEQPLTNADGGVIIKLAFIRGLSDDYPIGTMNEYVQKYTTYCNHYRFSDSEMNNPWLTIVTGMLEGLISKEFNGVSAVIIYEQPIIIDDKKIATIAIFNCDVDNYVEKLNKAVSIYVADDKYTEFIESSYMCGGMRLVIKFNDDYDYDSLPWVQFDKQHLPIDKKELQRKAEKIIRDAETELFALDMGWIMIAFFGDTPETKVVEQSISATLAEYDTFTIIGRQELIKKGF